MTPLLKLDIKKGSTIMMNTKQSQQMIMSIVSHLNTDDYATLTNYISSPRLFLIFFVCTKVCLYHSYRRGADLLLKMDYHTFKIDWSSKILSRAESIENYKDKKEAGGLDMIISWRKRASLVLKFMVPLHLYIKYKNAVNFQPTFHFIQSLVLTRYNEYFILPKEQNWI